MSVIALGKENKYLLKLGHAHKPKTNRKWETLISLVPDVAYSMTSYTGRKILSIDRKTMSDTSN